MRRTKIFLAAGLVALTLTPPAPADHILPGIPISSSGVVLQTVATGLGAPNTLTTAPGDPSRLYVADQGGLVRVIQNGVLQPNPVLDVRTRVLASGHNPAAAGDERGLLGLAFHPGFNNPASAGFRKAYTYTSEGQERAPDYPIPPSPMGTTTNHHSVVTEWTVDASGNFGARRELLRFAQPQSNHNGGDLKFDRNGLLHISSGDGGAANDRGNGHQEPRGNAQELNTVLGKILRIDPITTNPGTLSANGQYRIPVDNPFQGAGQAGEIYAYGLRNPFRMSFDRDTGMLILGDVGQNNIEEVNIITRGGNYGWAVKEGSFLFDRLTGTISTRTPVPGLIDPIFDYDHGDGITVIGGFVYRGTEVPELFGKYIFGDFLLPSRGTGRLFVMDLDTRAVEELRLLDVGSIRLLGFGEDANGELYLLSSFGPSGGTQGTIYRIAGVAVPEPGSLVLMGLGAAGLLGFAWRRRRRSA